MSPYKRQTIIAPITLTAYATTALIELMPVATLLIEHIKVRKVILIIGYSNS